MKTHLIIALAALLLCSGLAAQTPAYDDPDQQYATQLLKKGDKAPQIRLNDIDGKPFSLKSLKGRRVVLVFWASWCPDCRAEVPELKAMYEAADPSEVAFVSVSFDREFEKFKAYVADNALPGIQLFDPSGKKDSAVGRDYHVKWIPSLYLIDAKGKVEFGTVVASKIANAL
ncbi:MAG: TlpA family protein disulfide reductase [Bacteroidales bacterium]|jgi:peroxiredoxin|nr:TlpA family protein disulfide reductase [Bacteroidales bacterium]